MCWALNKSYSHLFYSPPLPPLMLPHRADRRISFSSLTSTTDWADCEKKEEEEEEGIVETLGIGRRRS